MSTGTEWQVGSDSRVIVHPEDKWDPHRMFIADASYSVTLLPPTDREKYSEFVRFLEDLAEGAREFAVLCQSLERA